MSIRSHLITLHCDVCVRVQVNLNWAQISRQIKNILIVWQYWLAADFRVRTPFPMDPDLLLMSAQLKFAWKTLPREVSYTNTSAHNHNTLWNFDRWVSPNAKLSVMDRLEQRLFEVGKWSRFLLQIPFCNNIYLFILFGKVQMVMEKSQCFHCLFVFSFQIRFALFETGKLTFFMAAIIRRVCQTA